MRRSCPILAPPPQPFRPLAERVCAPSAPSFHPLTSTKSLKTIAITVDDAILRLLDELTAGAGRRRTRSALVRAALREFAERERRRVIEEREREIFRSHRKRLAREARLFIEGQARS